MCKIYNCIHGIFEISDSFIVIDYGSFAYILPKLHTFFFSLWLQPTPQVAILPLGTGNDLARVLDWGEGYTGDVDVRQILDQLETAVPAKLDRWVLTKVKPFHFNGKKNDLIQNITQIDEIPDHAT